MHETPFISIIVPVYNVSNYILECIHSILRQSYSKFELIIIDDGSTDDSGRICDNIAVTDARIKVIHKHNGGLSSSRNAGMRYATGEYVAFIDSDDFIDDDYIEKLINKAVEDKSDIVVAPIKLYYNQSNISDFHSNNVEYLFADDYIDQILHHKIDNSVCNKILNREIIKEHDLRFKEGIINEDFPFMLEYLKHSNSASFIKDAFYYYRQRNGSITQQANPRLFDFINNAIESKTIVGKQFTKSATLYLLYEAVNFISTVEKYDESRKFENELKFCKQLVNQNKVTFLFGSIQFKQKCKYILVSMFPVIYRWLLKRI